MQFCAMSEVVIYPPLSLPVVRAVR